MLCYILCFCKVPLCKFVHVTSTKSFGFISIFANIWGKKKKKNGEELWKKPGMSSSAFWGSWVWNKYWYVSCLGSPLLPLFVTGKSAWVICPLTCLELWGLEKILGVPFSVIFLLSGLFEVNKCSTYSASFFPSFSLLILSCFSLMNLLYKMIF